MEAARGLGVVFDIGHSIGGFGFDVGRAMLDGGLAPDVISSDVHVLSADGPATRLHPFPRLFGHDLRLPLRSRKSRPHRRQGARLTGAAVARTMASRRRPLGANERGQNRDRMTLGRRRREDQPMTNSDAKYAPAPPIADGKFDVGGILLDRPFKIRRLGHFGINVTDMEAGLRFYRELLGFRITDIRDPFAGKEVPDEIKRFGDHKGYFFRYASDHHAFVMYNHNVRGATDTKGRWRRHVTINQITWQVGSLGEIVHAIDYFKEREIPVARTGRDMPGSNWHTYLLDPDGHNLEAVCHHEMGAAYGDR